MKFSLILVILYSVLANVYTIHLFSKFGHKNYEYSEPSVTYQEEKVVSPAKIYVEVKQKTPVYSAPAEVPRDAPSGKKHFDLLGHFKNKFGKLLSPQKTFAHGPVVQSAPAEAGYETHCFRFPPQQQYYVPSAQQFYEQAAPAQVYQQTYPNQIPLQVYRIPLNSEESSGKPNIFGKIKSHFGHKDSHSSSSNGPHLKIVVGQHDDQQNSLNADSRIYVRNDVNLDNAVEPRIKVREENKNNEALQKAEDKH